MELKFIVDFMCGRLARWLRILGYDTELFQDNVRNKILLQSLREQRIILSRDTHLSNKKAYKLLFIKSDSIREQVKQVVTELNLQIDKEKLFSRCSLCNQSVVPTEKNKIKNFVPPYIFETNESFYKCPKCNRVYWQGTHFDLFINDIKNILPHFL